MFTLAPPTALLSPDADGRRRGESTALDRGSYSECWRSIRNQLLDSKSSYYSQDPHLDALEAGEAILARRACAGGVLLSTRNAAHATYAGCYVVHENGDMEGRKRRKGCAARRKGAHGGCCAGRAGAIGTRLRSRHRGMDGGSNPVLEGQAEQESSMTERS